MRDQLVAARTDLRRHLAILEAGPVGKGAPFIDYTTMIAELRMQLSQIDDALANLGADHS